MLKRVKVALYERALVEVELVHRDAGAIGLRDEVPVETARMIHRELTRASLLRGQRVQKRLAVKHHPPDGLRRCVRRVHQTIPL
jgi:hypothetical protein